MGESGVLVVMESVEMKGIGGGGRGSEADWGGEGKVVYNWKGKAKGKRGRKGEEKTLEGPEKGDESLRRRRRKRLRKCWRRKRGLNRKGNARAVRGRKREK